MSDLNFTPDEDQMRQAYWHHVYEHGVNLDRRDIDAEFTRGMEQIKAQARAEEREKSAQIAESYLTGTAEGIDIAARIRAQGEETGA